MEVFHRVNIHYTDEEKLSAAVRWFLHGVTATCTSLRTWEQSDRLLLSHREKLIGLELQLSIDFIIG